MTWKVIPRETQPQKMLVIGLIAVGVVALALIVTRQPVLALLGLSVIVASTAEFWMGTTYILGEKSVEAKVAFSGSQISWDDVKSVKMTLSHIYLSPFTDEHRLDAFRGVKLNLTNANRDQVIELIRERVGKDVRFLGG
jgi:hypothetical protein